MENGAFAQKEQMLHFPYFQIPESDISNSKASKGVIMELLKLRSEFPTCDVFLSLKIVFIVQSKQ